MGWTHFASWESILSGALEIGTLPTQWCGRKSPGFGVSPSGLRCLPSHYRLRPMSTPPWASVFPSKEWDNNVWLNTMSVILICLLHCKSRGWRTCSFPAYAFPSFYVKQQRPELCWGNRMLLNHFPLYILLPLDIIIDSHAGVRNSRREISYTLHPVSQQ